MDNKTPDVFPNLLWDTAKAYIRGLIISYVSNQKKKQLADQRKLEITLHGLQMKYNTSPSDVLLAEIETVKTSLEAILTNKTEKSVFFARQRMYEFTNKPKKISSKLTAEPVSSTSFPVSKIKKASAITTTKQLTTFLGHSIRGCTHPNQAAHLVMI